MIRISDTLAGDPIEFHFMEGKAGERKEVASFVRANMALGIDTESTGIDCYKRGWQLRTFQIGNANTSYVIPADQRSFIGWIMEQPINWIGHNGPHDMRSIDQFLGYETGVQCAGETYTIAHEVDSRNQKEGGTGNGLKELAIAHVDRAASKWEVELKKAFKQIRVPIPGEVYKSGYNKGKQKMRTITLSEGWGLIGLTHPAYIAYAAADPLLTYRLWRWYQRYLKERLEIYHFDQEVQHAVDVLQRRGMLLDERYTRRLDTAYMARANELKREAARLGCENIFSGQQIARALIAHGARMTKKTKKGALVTDDSTLREVMTKAGEGHPAYKLIQCILGAKQMLKRRESYTAAMLESMDDHGRVHPSINPLGARTTRMSVSSPPLQQLPTKDREADA